MKKLTLRVALALAIAIGTGASLALPSMAADERSKTPLARNEPHHHVPFQNEFVRIFRVVIASGDATLWHEHNFDYGLTNEIATTTGDRLCMASRKRISINNERGGDSP